MTQIEAAFAGNSDSEPEICYRRKNGTDFWTSVFITPVCDANDNVVQHFISFIDQTLQREKQAQYEVLIDELNHRVKNTLSTVQSIARQALRASNDPEVVRASIESRIFALASSHDLLTRYGWKGASLDDLVNAALQSFGVTNGRADRFSIQGSEVHLTPKATLALGVAFHELATNAVKFGALSNDVGRVIIAWDIETNAKGGQLLITWREFGGPVVAAPSHRGFGWQVIERGLSHELHGSVQLIFPPGGVFCKIAIHVPQRTLNG